jgi:hypothetical protein
MIHYNIGKKVEINPFEGVNVVTLSNYSLGKERLQLFLDNKSEAVEARKINGSWVVAYNINYLDFTTLVEWFAPLRGKFQFKGHWIHFSIENDTMSCW